MKLLEKFEAVGRQRRLADNTIDAYRGWIQQFLRFCATARGQWTQPQELGNTEVESFLNDLVTRRRLSASSQNQALNALVFLYAQVLDALPENHLGKFALLRSTRPRRVPTVLDAENGDAENGSGAIM
ncbi:MAG TPA: site-specific integrase [Humisphaera sp.]|nr:site-specific integrase [Humisphaera sp.]